MKLHHDIQTAHAASLELKATDQGRIEGYGSVFGNADRQGDIVLPGAFAKSLQRVSQTGDMPVMLWSHAQENPIGKWLHMAEDSKGLHVRGQLNLKTRRGREAYEHVKAGDAGGLSIGFTTPKGGREYVSKGVWHIKEAELWEISIVAIPANPQARIAGAKSLTSRAEAEDMLRSAGLSKKAAQRFAAGGWQALASDHDPEQLKSFSRQLDAAIEQLKG